MLLHQLNAFIVEENAVLDGVHACAHRIFDRQRRVCMGSNFVPETMSLRDKRLHFGRTVLLQFWIIAFREHSAGGAELDHVHAILHDLPNLVHHRFDAVRSSFSRVVKLRRQ